MSAKKYKYSYTAQREKKHLLFFFAFIVVIFFILFFLINSFIFSNYQIKSNTMEPTLSNNDYILISHVHNFSKKNNFELNSFFDYNRGDIVLVSPEFEQNNSVFHDIVSYVLQFFIIGKNKKIVSSQSIGNSLTLRRLIGMPGDSIYIENFIAHIKPWDSSYYLTEFELTNIEYNVYIDSLPHNWTSSLPFSGKLSEITLGKDEFFLIADNRVHSSDSTIWGPISKDRLKGKLLFRYLPFSNFGFVK